MTMRAPEFVARAPSNPNQKYQINPKIGSCMLILLNYKTCSGIQMSIDNDDESAWICRQLPPPSSSTSSLLLPSSLLVNPAPNEPSMRHRALDWKWLENILNLTQHCGFNHPAVYQTFLPTFCVVNVVGQKFTNGDFPFFPISSG